MTEWYTFGKELAASAGARSTSLLVAGGVVGELANPLSNIPFLVPGEFSQLNSIDLSKDSSLMAEGGEKRFTSLEDQADVDAFDAQVRAKRSRVHISQVSDAVEMGPNDIPISVGGNQGQTRRTPRYTRSSRGNQLHRDITIDHTTSATQVQTEDHASRIANHRRSQYQSFDVEDPLLQSMCVGPQMVQTETIVG